MPLLLAALTTGTGGYLLHRFRTPAIGLAYLRGERLILENPVVDLGLARRGETLKARFRVSNQTGAPVKILGSQFSCSCTRAVEMPAVIEANATHDLEFSFTANEGQTAGPYRGVVRLFTDSLHNHELDLALVATIAPL